MQRKFRKKFYIIFVFLLTFTFTPNALASLTISAFDITETGPLTINANATSTLTLGSASTTGDIIIGSAQTTGKVGIGTTNPAYKLDVVGDANITGTYRVNGNPISATSNWTLSGNDIYYTTGNIGIGTTSPAYALDVVGTGKLSTGLITNKIYPASNSTTAFQINKADGTTNVLNIDTTNGYVGIGTASPGAQLDITGTNSTATLGTEMISATVDQAFTGSLGNWTAGTNWAYGTNNASHTAGTTGTLSLANDYLSAAPVSGNIYQVTFSVNTTVAGTLAPKFGGINGITVGKIVGSDTQVQVFIAANSGVLTFTPMSGWAGTIDDVSVRQIAPSSATQIVRNSDGDIGLEIRSGGAGDNVFFGNGAGRVNTTGADNTALGEGTLSSNTTGSFNVAIGPLALSPNTTGSENIAIGTLALGSNTTGNYNTVIGRNALNYNRTGSSNTAVGYDALDALSTGSNNIALGYKAGYNLTTGSYNIVIGYNINTPSATSANTLNIGNLIFGTGIDGTANTLSSGNVGIGTTLPTSKLQVVGLPVYANNAAAVAGGLTAGAFYRTGADPDPVMVVH